MSQKRKSSRIAAGAITKAAKKSKTSGSDDEDSWFKGVESEEDVSDELIARIYHEDQVCTKSMLVSLL